MPLWEAANCPHTVTILAATSSTDIGGGTSVSYSTRTSGVKGFLNAVSAAEQERFAQMALTVSHTFSTTDTTAQRGDKLTYGSRSFHIKGIRQTEEVSPMIPQLNQILLEELL